MSKRPVGAVDGVREPAILFVDHATALGGAEHSLLGLLERLPGYGWHVHVACPEGALAEEARERGVTVHLVTFPRLRRSARFLRDLFDTSRRLATLASELQAGAIYANTVRAAFYSAVASRAARSRFVWHMRDFWLSENEPQRKWIDRLLKRLLVASASQVAVNSAAVAGHLPRSEKVQIILNGVDTAAFERDEDAGRAFRSRHEIPLDAPLVGTAGRLRPWKGQDRFLRVAKLVLDMQPDAHFVIAGGSPFDTANEYPKVLRAMAKVLGIEGRTVFTGHLADVRACFSALDLFVHSGDPEPFGLVNVEAMAMKLPVVAFAHGALPEIVVDGETGALVAPGDEGAMARCIVELLGKPDLVRSMGKRARARAEERFGMDRTARDVDRLLRRVVR